MSVQLALCKRGLKVLSRAVFCPPHSPTPLVSLTLNFLLALPPTQYEGHRLNEEVSEGEEGTVLSDLCVVFPPPHLLECEGGGGLRITGHGPLSLMVMNTAPHALPELASPLLGLVFVWTCLLHTVHWLCLVCVFSRLL